MKFGHLFQFSHYNEIFNKYFVFLHFLEGLHISVTETPWYFDLVLF